MFKITKTPLIISTYCLFLIFLSPGIFTKTIFAAAGDLDISFGGDGIVSTPIPNASSGTASDIVIQPDGKPVVSVLTRSQTGFGLAVVRYNPNGSLDTNFSGDGIVTTPFGSDLAIANAVALQSDGKILVAGSLVTSQIGGFFVLRFNPDGSFDTSFDGDGIVVNSVLNSASGSAIAVQTDGKILVAGDAFGDSADYFSVTRLNSNGSLDTGFGAGGKAIISFGLIDFFSDMALQPDGKIVLMGDADLSSSNPYLGMARFNSNGNLDTTFDGDGKVTTQIEGLGGSAVSLQTDGKILVGGSLSGDFAVLRYNPNGSLDTGFDGDGIVVTGFGATGGDAAHDLIVQPDNKIVAVGETAIGPTLLDLDVAIARYNPNGSLDTTFGSSGKVITRIGEGSDLANTAALQTDGKILLAGAGTELGSSQVALVRYVNQNRTRFDFDGDGKGDISVFRPSNGVWYLQQSTSGLTGISFGISSDKLVPADYDGDGKTDVAVVRNGTWYLQRSQLGFTGVAFGDANDIPMPADYDGDGKADIAVFRPSSGIWYLLQSSAGFTGVAFGQNGDKPVAADYDGDGKTDVAVFRPSNGVWYLLRSTLGFAGIAFGQSTDKPVAGDYDGDGMADVAVFRPSNGVWYLQQSTAGFSGITFGIGTDLPIPADYDGDGKTDIAVYRPSTGVWYLLQTRQGFGAVQFGNSTDIPIPFSVLP